METIDSGRSRDKDSSKQPFELDKDLSLSRGSSQEHKGVSKSLQPGRDQLIPPARYSYDEGDVASSLDSSVLQGQEVLDPLETSEDSDKPSEEPVTVLTVRQAILTDSEPQLFNQEKNSVATIAVQAGESASVLAFEVICISEPADTPHIR